MKDEDRMTQFFQTHSYEKSPDWRISPEASIDPDDEELERDDTDQPQNEKKKGFFSAILKR